MPSLWSLVEDLRNADIANHVNPPRFFSPPLAALIPTGGADDPVALPGGLPDPSVYSFSEQHVNDAAQAQTTDVAFTIKITPPAGGFPGDPQHPELPSPAFRFSAVAKGQVIFQPAAGNSAATLIHRTDAFGVIDLAKVPWWQRWSEAHCVPREIHYENVDVDHLRDYLLNIPLTGAHGLTFPQSKTAPINTPQAQKDFVALFLQGSQNGAPAPFVSVEAGAFIGHAALDPAATDGSRFVVLHARYADHTTANPQPMSPRELLYLLFGDQGPMAMTHPLLQQLDIKRAGGGIFYTAADNVLRPPLRTWARLIWEAGREAAQEGAPGQQPVWSAAASLPNARRFDHFVRNGNPVSYGPLNGKNKCNVFIADVSVRAGFRSLMMPIPNGWHAPSANSHAHFARRLIGHTQPGAPARLRIMGGGADNQRHWGYAMTRFLISRPVADINGMMDTEGRALILACARPRKMNEGNAVPRCVLPSVDPNNNAHLREGSGHIVFLQAVTNVTLVANNDVFTPGLPAAPARTVGSVAATSAQASTNVGAATNRNFNPRLGGNAANAGANAEFIRIHLLEAAPGRDPDLLQGLFDLHINAFVVNQLLTQLDRSGKESVTNSNPAQCCFDNTAVFADDQTREHQYDGGANAALAVRQGNC